MKEIEKKYLISDDIDLSDCKYVDIKQAYLNAKSHPTIRVRKYGDEYFLTYKNKVETDKDLKIRDEHELPITKEVYKNLKDKREGHVIKKRRYFVELDNGFTAEVDIFSGHLEGLRMVEVEFKSEEDYLRFEKPDWFLDDVTTDSEFSNSSLSGVSSISKIKKLKRK